MITTVSGDQTEILKSIMVLHNEGKPFDADLTYGNGGFWKSIPPPAYLSDIEPKGPGIFREDATKLTLPDKYFGSVVFDPPFIHAPGKASIMGRQFGGFKSQQELGVMYSDSLWEIYRVLTPKGLLVFKCQDIVESGKQVWNHIRVYEWARLWGFRAEDLFILTGKGSIVGHNHSRQVHARKTHSYFWVFRKK